MVAKQTRPIEVFFVYSHKDQRLRDQLETQLSLLRREGLISNWHDRKIFAGEEWEGQIDKHLNSAQIILLLISPDFIASDYCYDLEMKLALARHEAREALVIPIILRRVDWNSAPFGKLQALPKDGKPVMSWTNRDDAFFDIAKGIRKAVKEIIRDTEAASQIKESITSSSSEISISITSLPGTSTSNTLQETKGQKLSEGISEAQITGNALTEQTWREPCILVIDDEENLQAFIRLGLKYEGFETVSETNGPDGLATAQRIEPDLIILDWFLPGMDGLAVCDQLRSNPITQDIPILMISGSNTAPPDRVLGLSVGADDYLTKPFYFPELVARVNALLRRVKHPKVEQEEDSILECADLQFNITEGKVRRGGHLINLTVTESNLLRLFMSHPRQVLDRQTILNRVWGYDFLGETNIVEVYVRYLREKIEDSPSAPRFIQTVRGIGYVWKEPTISNKSQMGNP